MSRIRIRTEFLISNQVSPHCGSQGIDAIRESHTERADRREDRRHSSPTAPRLRIPIRNRCRFRIASDVGVVLLRCRRGMQVCETLDVALCCQGAHCDGCASFVPEANEAPGIPARVPHHEQDWERKRAFQVQLVQGISGLG